MDDGSPESPEARFERERDAPASRRRLPGLDQLSAMKQVLVVARRVGVGVYSDGFIHAGNLAYLTLVTLFPFFIVAAAIARLMGRSKEGLATVDAFLRTLPPGVAEVLKTPIDDVLNARSGSLLWLGALVGLWTAGSFIETIRDILRRAYGVKSSRPFWEYRLRSLGIIIISVLLALAALSLQVLLVGVEQFIVRLIPMAENAALLVLVTRLATPVALFVALYMLFLSLTPGSYRARRYPKWPGPLFVTLWWFTVSAMLPLALAQLGGYDLTYGSLAGVMIALIFFYFIGFGLVIGAELNAALAERPASTLEAVEGEDNNVGKDGT